MEADWSVELAAEDPVIVVPWAEETLRGREGSAHSARFIDLRENPPSVDKLNRLLDQIEEARDRPALREALHQLNREGSKFFTAKCDAWENGLGNEDANEMGAGIDPWEMDAISDDAIFSAGCYIDLLLRDGEARASFEMQERWIRRLTKKLRGVPLRCVRTDLVLRRSEIDGVSGYGVTWFVESCGASVDVARQRWAEALSAALSILTDERWLHRDSSDATIAKSRGE